MPITASPHWEWWLIGYFFLGGIAAGAYFIAGLIQLVGNERDRELADAAYIIAFPLIIVCTIFLILDLGRPERFWHMMLQSQTFRPMFKYWSPMSYGSWILAVFGGLSFISFLAMLTRGEKFGMKRFRGLADWLHRGVVGKLFAVLQIVAGFALGSYTGSLVSATNVPFWSDSTLIGALFMASAASTGIATMILLRRRTEAHDSLAKLEVADTWALGLELLMLIGFVVSLGSLAFTLLRNPYGLVLVLGTGVIGLLLPLLMRLRPRALGNRNVVTTALLVLVGGFLLRFGLLKAGQSMTFPMRHGGGEAGMLLPLWWLLP